MTDSQLTTAEQAAAEALAERHNTYSDTDRLSTAAFAGEARAVVEAVRGIIAADALSETATWIYNMPAAMIGRHGVAASLRERAAYLRYARQSGEGQ